MNIRTTNVATSNSMMNYLSGTETKYYQLLEQASSGHKVSAPSDNPTSTRSILNINTKLDQLSSYLENMSTAQTELDTLDSSLANLTNLIQNANDLATQAANGTYNQTDYANFKTQIDSILASVIDVANTQYNGKYMFSGAATATETYTTDVDGNIVYGGTNTATDAYKRYTTISDGVSIAINAPGDEIFGSYTAAIPDDPATVGVDESVPASGTGLIGTLKLLSDALATGDKDVIRGSIDKLDTCLDTVSATRTEFAAVSNRFKITENAISTSQINLKSQRSALQDIDLTEVLTSLASQKLALEASMSMTKNLLSGQSLLDYM